MKQKQQIKSKSNFNFMIFMLLSKLYVKKKLK